MFFGIQCQVLWFDLSEKIADKFQSIYKQDFSADYMSNVYSSNFSKDPFGDAVSNMEDKSKQLNIAWAKYVENLLNKNGCYLSQKKIRSILYYFVPEFRTELTRSLKQEQWDYDSKKYQLNKDKLMKYCEEYYECENFEWYSVWNLKDHGLERIITAATSADVETNCKEFFQENYKKGQNNMKNIQKVEVIQAWSDKYWNSSVDDSPYDIMSDFGVLAKLLYRDAEEAITPVFYNIPMFSNSKKNLDDRKNSNSSDNLGWGVKNTTSKKNLDGEETGNLALDNWLTLLWWSLGEQNVEFDVGWKPLGETKVLPFSLDVDWWYDDLLDWLNSLRIENEGTDFYHSLCKDQKKTESNQEVEKEDKKVTNNVHTFSELSDQEYQEIIDYMVDAVDTYSELPVEKEEEIQQKAWDVSGFLGATTPNQIEDAKEQIKNCWKSCEWLRIDQKASCMLKCACWEIKSPIFNPEETPWLWPIFLIRFCAVPAVNTNFSVGWKRIHSIEEWWDEIYWVVDKLSREWKLWKWTQQYEFLDSSTKRINIADTLAFTIDVEFVDITNKKSTHSDQYGEKELENFNKKAQSAYWISNSLNNPSKKNAYRVSWNWQLTEMLSLLGTASSSLETTVNLLENSGSLRYNMNAESLANWMNQQWSLRTKLSEDVINLTEYSKALYGKKS